jgi:SpoVK/Ycf46/Vps4 family AAA+-type ATPase
MSVLRLVNLLRRITDNWRRGLRGKQSDLLPHNRALILPRYSGSDIAIVVRDALMQPVRKVLSATHFKQVRSATDPKKVKYTPCSPGDPEAEEKSWTDIEGDELHEPPLRMADFLKSLDSVRPTVTESDIKRHDEWTKESGEKVVTPHHS